MRILTWNVLKENSRLKELIDYAYNLNPDIICFQEVSFNVLNEFINDRKYFVYYTTDFINPNEYNNGYICTLSKIKPEESGEFEYFSKNVKSILNNIIYKIYNNNSEQHNAVTIKIKGNGNDIQIVNARLSCAIGPNDRILQFHNILKEMNRNCINILCGDFNIVDSKLFNILTGWTRGFRLNEYNFSERDAFEKLCDQYNMVNLFKDISTSVIPKLLLQFDHILVPKDVSILYKEVSKVRFGSDHNMLLADINI